MAKMQLLTTAFLLLMFGYGQSTGPTAISVIQVNGKTEISLDGVKIDLSKAKIVQEDDYNVVLSPIEAPGAVITIGKKENGKVILDYKGQHLETIRPEDIEKTINANMAQMNLQMEEMRQRIQDMQKQMFSQFKFPTLPFMGGMPGVLG